MSATESGGSAGGFGPPLGRPIPRVDSERGQATVEFALCLPILFLLLLAVVQVGIVARDQVMLTHAAREAAREAAVGDERTAPRRAALARSGLDSARLEVRVEGQKKGSRKVKATLRYEVPTRVAVVGVLVPEVTLRAEASMRREGE